MDTPAKEGLPVVYGVDQFDGAVSNISARAAFITKINADETVNLMIVPDGGKDVQRLNGNPGNPTALIYRERVEYSKSLAIGCWSLLK